MTELHQSGPPAGTPGDAPSDGVRPGSRFNPRAIIVGVIFVVIVGLAIWYLARPEPLLVQRKAEIDRAGADVTLAQQTYDRTQQLVSKQFAPRSKLDLDTDALTAAKKRFEQTKLAYDEAVRGFTAEEHQIAEANVGTATARIATIKALVDQLTVVAPVASQIYRIHAEDG